MSKETNYQLCNILYQLLVNRNLAATDQLTVSSGYLVLGVNLGYRGLDIICVVLVLKTNGHFTGP